MPAPPHRRGSYRADEVSPRWSTFVFPLLGVCLVLLALAPTLSFGLTTIYGEGGTSANLYWQKMAAEYPYTRDSVSINWAGKAVLQSMADYTAGLVDFIMIDSQLTDAMIQQGYYGLPLMGSAMVMVYNIPELNNTQLILDGETLALIWCGNISRWNDPALVALNPGVAMPDAQIKLTWYPGQTPGTVLFLKAALSNFSSVFKAELAAAGNLLENITAMASNNYTTNNPFRLTYVQQVPYSMTYYWLEDVLALSVKMTYAAMKNRAGYVVQPNSATVQSAMTDFAAQVDAGDLATPLYNGPGKNSWPMPFITFLCLFQNTTRSDCRPIQELTNFIAWTQLNDQVITAVSALGYMPLAFDYRSKLVDAIGTIRCNGELALPTAYLLGTGPSYGVYTSWVNDYSSPSASLKIYPQSSDPSISDIAIGVVDFVASVAKPTASELAQAPDLLSIPLTATAIAPGYYLPTLFGNVTLNFDMEVLAQIYLNQITMWNDARIAALNPNVALPASSIVVVADNQSAANALWIAALRQANTQFANAVSASALVSELPIFVQAPARTVTISNSALGVAMKNQISFAMGYVPDILSVRGLAVGSVTVTTTTASGKRAVSVLEPSTASVLSALNAYTAATLPSDLILAAGADSWPFVQVHHLYVRSTSMANCLKAEALADWVYWTQTSSSASSSAGRSWAVVPTQATYGEEILANFLASIKCDGEYASSVYDCIINGTFCSDHGKCTFSGVCQCDKGWEGSYCESVVTSSTSSLGTILGAVLGTTVPIGLLILLVFAIVVLVGVFSRRKEHNEWEMDYSELEVGEQMGAGGYGVVYKAKWRGTEVAVKTMVSKDITKEHERSFKEEVLVMTALRHPNVVLFMGASTKAPNLCIVMEYMALGSLFDLLHNELIADIPFILKTKMAYQTAKGMHFLHSSGVVHRDLKSMNLLLDSKWNVKVSDFGLTKFKASLKNEDAQIGSVHWSAPEILGESPGLDYILADVYAFGIILWELLTREMPYYGLSPAAVAVAVLRDNSRPTVPEDIVNTTQSSDYVDLMRNCWHHDPIIRPTFLEVMTRLSSLTGETGTGTNTKTSTSSSSSGTPGNTTQTNGSWTVPTHSTGSSSVSSVDRDTGAVKAPEGALAVVFTDVTRAASLWEFNSEAMLRAMILHNEVLRAMLIKHHGYEVRFSGRDNGGGGNGDGSFCVVFADPVRALEWCTDVQQALLTVEWPEALLAHPGAAEEWDDVDDRPIFKGLRVRMGINFGEPRRLRDVITRRVEYHGSVVNIAAHLTTITHGGQVLFTKEVYEKVKDSELMQDQRRCTKLGRFEVNSSPSGMTVYELKIRALEARFFGGVAATSEGTKSTKSHGSGSGSGSGSADGDDDEDEVMTAVGEGLKYKEDNFLTSANLCRWIIDFGEIMLGKQVGMGSYGVVYRGKWKGVDVAVKRFINQKLDERRMLEFRSEMAFLSELHHPNIVLFIGACLKRPNMCILTEFMPSGSLADILPNASIKLEWKKRLKMLRSAAVGVNYLHSLEPCIIHRDLKPSNLLVDENGSLKVADFGLARIKEDNMTMTRCGTPCWTAPEVIKGEKYDEKADVYSFGIIMWEVITRKQPYAGRNFMGVSLDVLEGKRPQIPADCPEAMAKMVKKCWHASPHKRPSMEQVVAFFDGLIGQDPADALA